MFQVAFDFDLQEYRSNIEPYQKAHTRPYHFSTEERDSIVKACELLGRASTRVVRPIRG